MTQLNFINFPFNQPVPPEPEIITISRNTYNYNTIFTGEGNDRITVSGHSADIDSAKGFDYIKIKGKSGRIKTGTGNDSIRISGKTKDIDAGKGSDTIKLSKESEIDGIIDGGKGKDTLVLQKGRFKVKRVNGEIIITNLKNGNKITAKNIERVKFIA